MNELLFEFIKKHSTTYIYGDTEKHFILKNYIESRGYIINGLVVSDSQKVTSADVVNLSKIAPNNGTVGIVVAVLDKYYNEIVPNLINEGFKVDDIYFLPINERDTICTDFGKSAVKETYDIRLIKDAYADYCQRIIGACEAESYYMYCVHFDLGDLVQVFQLKQEFEEKYKAKLLFFITDKQRVVADICNVTDYVVVEKIRVENSNIDKSKMIELDILLFESFFMNIPLKGMPFVIPFGVKFRGMLNEKCFANHFSGWLNLDIENVECPQVLPISDTLKKKIGNLDLNKVVLIAPEANSMNMPQKNFWINLAEEEKRKGNIVITNAVNKDNLIPDTLDYNLTLRELFELAGNSKKVYSMRSGLCDCIAGMRGELNVYYWTQSDASYFGIRKNYAKKLGAVNEYLIDSAFK